jgi:MFS family permease
MLLIKALRNRAIFRLWLGQALSSVGDEIYRVGLTWIAVGLIGANAGYLNAAQAAALMVVSFVAGKWAEDWAALPTMIGVDLTRAFVVLIPVIYNLFTPVPLWLLAVTAVVLSGLGAFFDPALQSALPTFTKDKETLRATTGLMSTTTRLARMIGPGLVGFLAVIFPPIHFFTLDAVSFLFSALSVQSITERNPAHPGARHLGHFKFKNKNSFFESMRAGLRAVRSHRGMTYIFVAKAITSGTWNLAYSLGLALLIQQMAAHDTRAFGLAIACYGIGNFLGAVYFGNQIRKRSELMMFSGYIWLGVCFIAVGQAPTLTWVMIASALGGFGGPMNDLPFVDLMQARFSVNELARVFRLRMAIETASVLLLMLLAPTLFHFFTVRWVITFCGLSSLVVGLFGLPLKLSSSK